MKVHRENPKNTFLNSFFLKTASELCTEGYWGEDQLASPQGGSTLKTSAPMSVKSMVQNELARCCVRSTILMS